jgi:hypothetical protein
MVTEFRERTNPVTDQPLTSGLVNALYPNLYYTHPRTPLGHAFRDWYQRLGGLSVAWTAARQMFDGGNRNIDALLYYQLAARDVESTVILGDPTAMLPLRQSSG